MIAAQRAPRYTADSTDLTNNYGATILKKYWLIQAFLVDMPSALVDTLRSRPGLRYVRLADNPCGDVNPVFDEQDGRRYGLVPSALAGGLRERFGALAWLASVYTSAESPPLDSFP